MGRKLPACQYCRRWQAGWPLVHGGPYCPGGVVLDPSVGLRLKQEARLAVMESVRFKSPSGPERATVLLELQLRSSVATDPSSTNINRQVAAVSATATDHFLEAIYDNNQSAYNKFEIRTGRIRPSVQCFTLG